MSRSSKKGPFVEERLLQKIETMNDSGSKQMVGHKLGEFAPTRHFRGHAGDQKTQVKKR